MYQRTDVAQHLHNHLPLTMETQQILLPLPRWVHLDDTDWKTVGGSSKHSRGQSVVIFIQKLCKENGEKELDQQQLSFFFPQTALEKPHQKNAWSHLVRSSGSASYLPAYTASSLFHRTCWFRWWCCTWSNGCSCKAQRFRSPAKQVWTNISSL